MKSSTNISSISKHWNGEVHSISEFQHSEDVSQFGIFRSYLKDCRTLGLRQAERNARLLIQCNISDLRMEQNTDGLPEAAERLHLNRTLNESEACDYKNQLISKCRSQEQQMWLESVLSYLYVYYFPKPSTVPECLKTICKANHPIFTEAPGGCVKSWVLEHIKQFTSKCISPYAQPIWAPNRENSNFFSSLPLKHTGSRLGRVAVFGPSGVAAGNSQGFIFQNGLRTSNISFDQLQKSPSDEILSTLQNDYLEVSVIVVEEYSMASLLLLPYLDKITRMVRPAYSNVWFGGLVTILTGDCLQLQVVRSKSLLSLSGTIPLVFNDIYEHLSHAVFFLKLSKSMRQEKDSRFSEILLRMRKA
ncbi:DNA helicase Pif1-like protein [Gracilaria domingensis]|nr:DNA helicase Pif1-like protein [Gracilaria domingensis]